MKNIKIKLAKATFFIVTFNLLNVSSAQEVIWGNTYNYGPTRKAAVTLADVDHDGIEEILVSTSKALDGLKELRPAALLCINSDGTLRWSRKFPAIQNEDPQTLLSYQTTSVSSAPAVGDIDDDGMVDIVIGVGADSQQEVIPLIGELLVGQPGDKGGVYALDALSGVIKWYVKTTDDIGGPSNTGEGRADGVFSTPAIHDLDKDGNTDVIFGSWDRKVYVVSGNTGKSLPGWPVDMLDTVWSSPNIVDLDNDGQLEVLIGADITKNDDADITATGGVFHVLSPDGKQKTTGFDQLIGNNKYPTIRGKFEAEVIWSSPITADYDGDGFLEIAYGSGFAQGNPDLGNYIRVWNHDGSSKFLLKTYGRTFATPTFADLDGNGTLELLATTEFGFLYIWNNRGEAIVEKRIGSMVNQNKGQPIFSTPLAVDLDKDNDLEIVFHQGAHLMIIEHDGTPVTDHTKNKWVADSSATPAISDLESDGVLDIITAGWVGGSTDPSIRDQVLVKRFRYGNYESNAMPYRYARRMFREPEITVNKGIIFHNSFE